MLIVIAIVPETCHICFAFDHMKDITLNERYCIVVGLSCRCLRISCNLKCTQIVLSLKIFVKSKNRKIVRITISLKGTTLKMDLKELIFLLSIKIDGFCCCCCCC